VLPWLGQKKLGIIDKYNDKAGDPYAQELDRTRNIGTAMNTTVTKLQADK
jgi:hypothetical protein